MWAALVARDSTYNGKFYYSVSSTGIYCRPSCPARLPKHSNVRFHSSCAAAEAEGFRACKRCKPNGPSAPAQLANKVAGACRFIETAEVSPRLKDLAAAAGLSAFHFHRVFKSIIGVTPKAYADAQRHRRVRENLTKNTSITHAIYDAGFNSNGRFYGSATEVLGMTPSEFKSGGENALIRFAVGHCSLGSVLAAASAVGVCAILMGDDPAALLRDLQDRFPKAQFIDGGRNLAKLLSQVIHHIERPGSAFDLPLDIRGTAFQHQVWQALRTIAPGTTLSYAELAKRIGKPKAVRAVAGACAANPIAVVIPCHRVMRNDGALSGYRWGIERKRVLLAREQKSRSTKT